MADDDYPLNCIDETGDGFSGWFAISTPSQCKDFCYWEVGNASYSYAAWNIADPHHTTVVDSPIIGTSYWTCIYDASDDKTTLSIAKGERWIDSGQKYYPSSHNNNDLHGANPGENVPFPYLRCQKGAGERLKTWTGDIVRSATFWESWIVIASLIYMGEFVALFLFYKKRKLLMRYEQVDLVGSAHEIDGSIIHNDAGDSDGQSIISASLQIDDVEDDQEGVTHHIVNQQGTDSTTNLHLTPRCKYCSPLISTFCKDPKRMRQSLYILKIMLIVVANLLLALSISFSAISLMEITSNPHFSERMQKLTPACTDLTMVCPAGNADIDKQSLQWPPPTGDHGRRTNENNDSTQDARLNDATNTEREINSDKHSMQPFSYIMASDAQLYWFNGEFAEMGNQTLPPACSPSDSCGRCTGKHGLSTNRRLKKAWEKLMKGETNGLNASDIDDLPVPNTLIMNGDLTAYFHPYEKRAYDAIYDNIDGLKYYFPSLGNHDIEHHNGAMYGGDEWIGLPNCNIEHAIGYFKSGFCKQIPSFDTDRIVRYDSSSLAYSWDEGRYHFVHSHYYPTYEIATPKMNLHSSLEWLDNDLQTAYDAGLTTVLFVHAVQGLNPTIENIILGKNVKAIIAGHTHRCLHRRCEGIYPLREDKVQNLESLDIIAEKCIPAAYDTCQVLNGENLVYLKDMKEDVAPPKAKLHNDDHDDNDKPLCPKPAPFYINETDNSLLCHRVVYSQPNFPFKSDMSPDSNEATNSTETIPIFWSGSSSFETFLRGDFYEDRIVLNAMKVASEDGDSARYVDLHSVPNPVYPYHEASDVEETTIYL